MAVMPCVSMEWNETHLQSARVIDVEERTQYIRFERKQHDTRCRAHGKHITDFAYISRIRTDRTEMKARTYVTYKDK